MGGKSAPAPDYSGMEKVANRQLDFAERQYEELKPTITGLANTMQQSQEEQMRQARDYYDFQVNTYRPVEKGLVEDVANFDSEAYRQQLANKAAADAAQAFRSAQGTSIREAARRGVNPNSGAFGAASNANAMGLAAMQAGGMNQARQQAEQMAYARKLDIAGLGRGLVGASTGAYAGATGAGQAASGTYMAPGNQFQAGLSSAGSTFGNMANTQASVYNNAMNAQGELYGSILGAGITKFSDRRLKENIEVVGRDERTMLPLYEFEYKGGSGKRFIGVMADDVEKKFPEAVFEMPDGYKAVNYTMLGIEMIEV